MRKAALAPLWCAFLFFLNLTPPGFSEISPRLYTVEVSAEVQSSPPRIRLEWPADPNATGYTIHKKSKTETAWQPIAALPGSAVSYTDAAVALGGAYEYQILRSTSLDYTGTGYIYAGIQAGPVESRGKILLLVDSTHRDALAAELERLVWDLRGDGWIVIRHDIPRTMGVPEVKALIQQEYFADPENVRTVFLFGHIAVPYSGDYAGDSHQNHRGAWPTDLYYADMDGVWTDSTVTSTYAERTWNHNFPGDGKFDQSLIPSDLELEIGRVDLYNMTCFANKTPSRSELDLLRQYLNKDHKFRHGRLLLPRRGLICDNFGEADGEALASTGWRNFAPFFGAENNVEVPWGGYLPEITTEGYLCSYGTGGGGWYTCAGVAGSDDFAIHDIKSVFAFFFGSYFGDWDNESNFLRAVLGSTTYTLVTGWGGRPHWFLHHMALGETIGYSARLTENNRYGGLYQPQNFGTREVHTTLFGDPTLRLHPVIPVSNLTAEEESGGIRLDWNASPDTMIAGYHVYRGSSPAGPFTRVSGASPLAATTFHDLNGSAANTYMVRALKLETSGSGTYYNLSQGLFAKAVSTSIPPAAPSALSASADGGGQATLSWRDNADNELGLRVYRKQGAGGSYAVIAGLPANSTGYTDSGLAAGTAYYYQVTAYNGAGESSPSNEAMIETAAPSSAQFVREDSATGGSWNGTYGAEGVHIIGDAYNYPDYAGIGTSGNSQWVWRWNTSAAQALRRISGSGRIAACWYAASSFDVRLSFSGSSPRRVALYFLDWDAAGRQQVVEVIDTGSGQLLDSRTLTGFQGGVYLVWDLSGQVTFRIRALSGNAVLSGIFFDSAIPTAAAPAFSPGEGTYLNSVDVAISSATSGAAIHYTLDGTTPTALSPLYSGPVTIAETATLKARAFKDGLNPSGTASAKYTIQVEGGDPSASVQFLGANTALGGTWRGSYGGDGHLIASDSAVPPPYAAVAASGKSDWIWAYSTGDDRALQRHATTGRMASCWYAGSEFEVDINLTGGEHQVAFYVLDWDFAGRVQRVEIIDYDTRQVLHSADVEGFAGGAYLEYSIQGRVLARFTRLSGPNAVVSGVFFDPAP